MALSGAIFKSSFAIWLSSLSITLILEVVQCHNASLALEGSSHIACCTTTAG